MTSLIVQWNWFWQRKVPGKRGSVPSETMHCGEQAVNNSHTCIQRSLSSGWTTPICSRSKSQPGSRNLSTSLSNGSTLAIRGMRRQMRSFEQEAAERKKWVEF
jgi:hypothetical protein